MNLDQFCQVALLPQGHFQAFLRADSAQRHQLLARLFRTGRFERVEGWLRDHRLTLRRDSQTHLTAVADLVSRLSEAAAVAVPDEVADLSAASAELAVGVLGARPVGQVSATGTRHDRDDRRVDAGSRTRDHRGVGAGPRDRARAGQGRSPPPPPTSA